MFEKEIETRQQFMHNCPPDVAKVTNIMKNMADSLYTIKTIYAPSPYSYIYDHNILNDYADQGSVTARRLCDALNHFAQAFNIVMQSECISEEEEDIIVREQSQCYRTEHIVTQYPSVKIRQKVDAIVDRVLHRCSVKSNLATLQLDEDARVCYSILQMDSHEFILAFLNACKQKYPKTSYFFTISASINGILKRYEDAFYDANVGLELAPTNCDLLYSKAVALRLMDRNTKESIEAYRRFLVVAPNDHRKVPESYYAIASCYLELHALDGLVYVKEIYKQGEEAEKIQLPRFLPYESSSKKLLKTLVHLESSLNMRANPILNRKSNLEDLHRIEVITQHREWESSVSQINLDPRYIPVFGSHEPRVEQNTARSL